MFAEYNPRKVKISYEDNEVHSRTLSLGTYMNYQLNLKVKIIPIVIS